MFVGDLLFEAEHGPSSDDEINLLVAGGNYGWPHVAGFRDDQGYVYGNWSAAPDCEKLAKSYFPTDIPASVPQQKETEWKAEDFREPIKTFYTVPNSYNFRDGRCGDMAYLCWPTIAPSSVAYYPANGPIPGWGNSLLVTSLKNGALYRVPLNADGKTAQATWPSTSIRPTATVRRSFRPTGRPFTWLPTCAATLSATTANPSTT